MKISDGVVLAGGETGSGFFHRLLSEAIRRFPEALEDAQLPGAPQAFKRSYGDALARFESARVASRQRVEIAQFLRAATLTELRLRAGETEEPLLEALGRHDVPAPKTVTLEPTKAPGLSAELPLDGRVYRGLEVLEAVKKLHAAHHVTDAAAKALTWVVERIEAAGGALDLSAERFVLFGASAELSPIALLLQGGATVRWVDVKAPQLEAGAGRLISTEGGDDLLANPGAGMAAVRAFASEGPVHVGLFAYAPGASRELRLAGVMDAMVEALGPKVVKSVSLYISPTSPGETQPEDLAVAAGRGRAPRLWQRGFQTAGLLKGPGHFGNIARGVISLQGAGYEAAQYLTKIISGEVLATSGLGGQPVTLSVNVAGITNTRSLSHPLFQVAFQGAPQFGVRIFEPATTRAVSGLLMLHDLLNPEAPGAAGKKYPAPRDRARAVRTEQVHGGVYDLPWQFESAVKTAAVLGLGRRPDLLLRRARPA